MKSINYSVILMKSIKSLRNTNSDIIKEENQCLFSPYQKDQTSNGLPTNCSILCLGQFQLGFIIGVVFPNQEIQV